MDPFTQWFSKFTISYLQRAALDAFRGTPLFRDLSTAADRWRSGLPEDAYLPDIASLLGITTHGPNDTGLERQRRVLEKLLAYDIPTVDDWQEDLLVRWEWVRSQDGERAPFFTISSDVAHDYISQLAHRLHGICKISEPHFRSTSYSIAVDTNATLHSMNTNLESCQHTLQALYETTLTQLQTQNAATLPDVEHELRIALGALDANRPDVALTRLDILRERHWAQMTPRDRYRLVANAGFAHLANENTEDAANCLISARQYNPDDERARVNEAMGYALQGDTKTASRLSDSLVTDFPTSDLAFASYVRYSTPDIDFASLESLVQLDLRNAPETCLALAFRALASELPETAEIYARKALVHNPSAAVLNEVLGYALIEQSRHFVMSTLSDKFPEEHRSRLNEASTCFSNALRDTPPTQTKRIATLRFYLGCATSLLGQHAESLSHFHHAYNSDRTNPDYARQYAAVLLEREDDEGAVSILRASASYDVSGRTRYFLAHTLRSLDPVSHRKEAKEILDGLLSTLPTVATSFRIDILEEMLSLSDGESFEEDAEAHLERVPEGTLPPHAHPLLRSMASRMAGHGEEACKHIREALTLLSDDIPYFEKRRVAIECKRAGLERDSICLWKSIIGPHVNPVDAAAVVALAYKTEDFDFALRLCDQLRHSGHFLRDPIHIELNILQRFHCIPSALQLMGELRSAPIDEDLRREVNARHSHLSLLMELDTDCDFSVEGLPRPESVIPPLGLAVVDILTRGPDRLSSVKYAYELVRRNFESHFAHQAVVLSFFPPGVGQPDLPECETVTIGSAVCFVEVGSTDVTWCIIEDSHNPQRGYREYSPTDSLAVKLLGKRVGDSVELSSGQLGNREAQIVEIIPKFVYRLRMSMDNWERDFPEHPFLWQLQFPRNDDGSIEMGELLKVLDSQRNRMEECEEVVRSTLASATLFATAINCTALEAALYCGCKEELPVRCPHSSFDEVREGITAIHKGHGVVLDSTALATLYLTGEISILGYLPGKKFISWGIVAELMNLSKEMGRGGGLLTSLAAEGALSQAISISRNGVETGGLPFYDFIEAVKEECTLVEGFSLVRLDEENRKNLVDRLGSSTAESIALAQEEQLPIWTDDFLVGAVCHEDVKLETFSSEAVSYSCATHGYATEAWRDRFLLRLIEMGYTPVQCTWSMIAYAGADCGWSPSGKLLRACIKSLERNSINGQAIVAAAIRIMFAVFESAPREFDRTTLISLVWESIGKRHDRSWVWARIRDEIERVNTVDVTIRSGVLSILGMWQAARRLRPS
ncbi:MAG: hypothetical protein KF777_06650 [Planctomycetaceae bacterium]|nr:hypothetical protein [Planctomycetaceae bacterium]